MDWSCEHEAYYKRPVEAPSPLIKNKIPDLLLNEGGLKVLVVASAVGIWHQLSARRMLSITWS